MSEPTTSFRASKLEDWEIQAANRLKVLFEKADMSQKTFGATWGIGTAGMVSQYLNAKRPLGLQAAIKFAKGFKCSVADISPTLAASLPNEPLYTDGSKQPIALMQQSQAATNNIATIEQTLDQLGALLEKADSKTRNDVAALLLRYAQDPAQGKRLAQAIGILLGETPHDSGL